MEKSGYLFYTEHDEVIAEAEQKKIDYLEARMDYSRPEVILQVYENAIQERIFKTPVGLLYLKQLQGFLLDQPEIDPEQVKPIPLFVSFCGELREQTNPTPARVKPAQGKKKDGAGYQISVILNVLLVLALLAMFTISFYSEQPNVFNYERAVTDKYASWDQELTEKEQELKSRERKVRNQEMELGIDSKPVDSGEEDVPGREHDDTGQSAE